MGLAVGKDGRALAQFRGQLLGDGGGRDERGLVARDGLERVGAQMISVNVRQEDQVRSRQLGKARRPADRIDVNGQVLPTERQRGVVDGMNDQIALLRCDAVARQRNLRSQDWPGRDEQGCEAAQWLSDDAQEQ